MATRSAIFPHFKRGLECLARDDFYGCAANLERGMQLNTSNAALNKDMRRVLDDVAAHLAKPPLISRPRRH